MPDLRPQRIDHFPGGTVLVLERPAAELSIAHKIAHHIREANGEGRRAILGLATGSSPVGAYRHLVALSAAGEVSFERVATYNLDEYYPMSPDNPNSYRAFMERHLFDPIGLPRERAHLLDGTVLEADTIEHARDFDRQIVADGGLDLQLLGIGRNGHIGFNEPSDLPVAEALMLPTRLVDLHPSTRADAVKDFGAEDLVPRRALTVGPATILASRIILVLAFGAGKAEAVAQSLTGPMTARVPGSLLQSVGAKVLWFIDPAAASRLFEEA